LRFGLWNDPVDWQHIFKSPEYYLENLRDDAEIENNFKYVMPDAIRKMFSKSTEITINIEEEFKKVIAQNLRSKEVIEKSLNQHALMCVENTTELTAARMLSKLLNDDIESRIRCFVNCLGKTSKNYREWLIEDYKTKLSLTIGKKFRELNF
jgi:hypothetical protein